MKPGVLVLTGGPDLVMLRMGPLELEIARLFFRLDCRTEWWWLVPEKHARALGWRPRKKEAR
jgi:hypothetical protein